MRSRTIAFLAGLLALGTAFAEADPARVSATRGQSDSWLWSTGDFKADRGWTDEHVPRVLDTKPTNQAA
jgi:hypothetical protein